MLSIVHFFHTHIYIKVTDHLQIYKCNSGMTKQMWRCPMDPSNPLKCSFIQLSFCKSGIKIKPFQQFYMLKKSSKDII